MALGDVVVVVLPQVSASASRHEIESKKKKNGVPDPLEVLPA